MTDQQTPETAEVQCSHCPPACKSCEPASCECYRHQDWPDTRLDRDRAARNAVCIDGPGCDGYSHGIDCNNVAFSPGQDS